MMKHWKKIALACTLAVALLGGVIIAYGSGDPEDPPGIFMVHTIVR